MKNKIGLHRCWIPHRQDVSPIVIFHMLDEVLFPRKTEILGFLLFLLAFLLLVMMVAGILQVSFAGLLLALIITISGVCLWVIGYIG